MKRLGALLSLTFAVLNISSEQIQCSEIQSNIPVLDLKDCEILQIFFRLWKHAGLLETERAIWIVRNANGQFESKDWGRTPQRWTQVWNDPLPDHVVSIAHTHPVNVDPKPSKQDQVAALKLGIAVYTISRKGIWRVTPDGVITQEESLGWYKRISENCKDESELSRGQSQPST
jgi:hypothetical protein